MVDIVPDFMGGTIPPRLSSVWDLRDPNQVVPELFD
jgi:hypothetical protein